MRELALFAGAGGGILGGKLLGWRTVCAVECDEYARRVLVARQNDGSLEPFPIWDDVRTFDGRPWKGFVDVVSGGFPCQAISPANNNGKGIKGEKSGLWTEMLRVICKVEPEWVLVENSAHLRTKGLDIVLKGLAEAGYNATWGVLSASTLGADHERGRMWVVAHSNRTQLEGGGLPSGVHQEDPYIGSTDWWEDQPGLERVANGMANQMDRLKAIGNGQVPIVAATAFKELQRRLNNAY